MGQSPPGASVIDWDGEANYSNGLPFVQGNAEFGRSSPRPVKWCTKPLKVAEVGDTLISVRAPVGETNRADDVLAIGRGLTAIRFVAADADYGWHLINHARSEFQRVSQGSTFRAIGRSEVNDLALAIPPVPEQQGIAAVLDAIDEAIERIEAVIRATERLRHALLHELLTRGVPGWHTQWRRVSGLGVFPSDWRVIELRDIGQLRYGTSMQLSSTGGGYAVLRIPNVAPGYLDTSVLKFADLSQREADVLSLQSGDLLIVRTNGNPDICGQSVVFDGLEGKWAFASYLLRLRTESRVLSPIYLWAFLRSAVGRRQLRANVQTSAGNYNLSVGGLASVRMALPEIEEQMRIVEVVQSLADSLAREACRIGRLRNLRSSVSDALLTGRVRTIDVREPAI